MIDNMSPGDAAKCVEIVRSSDRPGTLVEISGGVSLETTAAYATTGADLLSTSMITQSAPALDIGLDLGAE
jgi:nicotinate-nucleotide pyrophosphorylase (carboxylating)